MLVSELIQKYQSDPHAAYAAMRKLTRLEMVALARKLEAEGVDALASWLRIMAGAMKNATSGGPNAAKAQAALLKIHQRFERDVIGNPETLAAVLRVRAEHREAV
jgi:hypothetical protein